MSRQTSEQLAAAPSKKAIGMATLAAFLVAAVLLVTAVLPAEYGIDPLGTGKLLRLTDLAKVDAKVLEKPAVAAEKTDDAPATIVPVFEASPDGTAPLVKGTFIGQSRQYKIDSREIKIEPGKGM